MTLWADYLPVLVTIPFVANGVRLFWRERHVGGEFSEYVRTRYPDRYSTMAAPEAWFRDFWGRGTLAGFLVFSREDWNDPNIGDYRRRLDRALLIWLAHLAAAAAAFAVVALFLEWNRHTS